MVSSLFLLSFLSFSSLPLVSFKVNCESEAACHCSFVYSDKIAAFIVCQINLKNGREEDRGQSQGGREEWKKRKKKKKQQHPYRGILLPGLFLSVCDKFKHPVSLLSSFLHIFSSPYLLSQHCITCHFRIMSSHVYNDIAFVPQITLGFSAPPTPTTLTRGLHTQICKCQRKSIHKPWNSLFESS